MVDSYLSCKFVFSLKQLKQLKEKFAREFAKDIALEYGFEESSIIDEITEELTIREVFLSLGKPMMNTANCIVEAHFKDHTYERHIKRLLFVLPCKNGKPDGRKPLNLS
jgi:hypothetical protein